METESAIARRNLLRAAFMAASVLTAGSAAGQAQQPIRIGASISETGSFAQLGQNQMRGYQLCVKSANDKGGVLGRRIELLIEDDKSQSSDAAAIYEKLIARDKVDAILGPYSSPITEAVADVAEKYRLPMLAPNGSTASIFKKGRKFVFQATSPAEDYLEGTVAIAAAHGLKKLAVVYEDTLFPKASALGAANLAKQKGMEVVLIAPYEKGTKDFTGLAVKLRDAAPDAVAAATYFDDAVAIVRKLKEQDVNPKMFAVTVGGDLPQFQELLGRDAEFIYGASQWEAELVTLRAGGLIPVARQYPGAREFVEAHRKEYPGADLSYHTAAGYGSCQVLLAAIERAGSLAGPKVREEILKYQDSNVYGRFRVDETGLQTAHKMVTFQWQDGKKAIVWPEELAPGKPRFPTPPWSQRP